MYHPSLRHRTPCPGAARLACSAALLRLAGAFVVDVSRSTPAEPPIDVSKRCPTGVLGVPKKYDLVVFGATGLTGRLSAEYLAKGHRLRPRWAIAGRSQEKLDSLHKKLADSGPDTAAPSGTIVANLNDEESLLNMTRQARVVLSFAGPYEYTHGERLVDAAIKGCAHYADISGETPWKATVLAKYGEAAKKRGVTIAQSVGYDSMPYDLLARLAAEAVAADGQGPPTHVLLVTTKENTGASAGSVKSAVGMLGHLPEVVDPYALIPGTAPDARVDKPMQGTMLSGYNFVAGDVLQPTLMSIANLPVVHRTLDTLFPADAISASMASSQQTSLELAKFLLDPRAVSEPPVGPPKWVREKGSWAAHAIATRMPDGLQKVVYVEGQGDPGYQGTSRMATEFALAMLPSARSKVTEGYVTPALAMDIKTLRAHLEAGDGGRLMHFVP